MGTIAPPVTAVMPARNDADHIGDAVRSVLDQDYAGDLDVVIALAPSVDGTEAVVRAIDDGRVRIVANPAGGTAAGLNRAIDAATGALIVRVDAHCELPRDYVSRAVALLQRTGAANVGGVQRAVGTTSLQRAVAAAMSSPFGVGDARFHYGGPAGPVDTVYLGVFDREALTSAGGFDETLVRNQDYELNIRLRNAGGVVWFDPELEVVYRPRTSVRALARQYRDYGRWKRAVVHRHPRSIRLRQVIAPATVVGIAGGVALALTGRRWGLAAPVVYAAATLVATVTTTVDRPEDRRHLPIVYPTMHLSWGAGFLWGPPRHEPRATVVALRAATLAADRP